MIEKEPSVYFIDLFCGCGGVTEGIVTSRCGKKVKVAACINHDANAILSHQYNHPDILHFTEDIRTIKLWPLVRLIDDLRRDEPYCIICLWASLECTNFSNAKGGLPRDADSRTLADDLFRYLDAINPDYLWIENVVEFMSWGDLDEHGKPISRDKGREYNRWVEQVKGYGYQYQHRVFNCADYGCDTSRKRLFIQFAKPQFEIKWPLPTHNKKGTSGLKKWKAVKHVLRLDIEGQSIFTRKKALSENTLKRVYEGLIKHVANGDTEFLSLYYSGVGKSVSTDSPARSITTIDHHAIVQPNFLLSYLNNTSKSIDNPARTITAGRVNEAIIRPVWVMKYNSTNSKGVHVPPSVDEPMPVISTQNRLGIVKVKTLLDTYYGNGAVVGVESPCPTLRTKDTCTKLDLEWLHMHYGSSYTKSTDEPCPTITSKDKISLFKPRFMDMQFSNGQRNKSIEEPLGALTVVPKSRLVTCEPWIMDTQFSNVGSSLEQPAGVITANRKWHYLMVPQWGSQCSHSIEKPSPTLLACMDKTPPYLIQTEEGYAAIEVYDTDSPYTVLIKQFMAAFGIVDIKMRMLLIEELLKITGFPETYNLIGTQAEKKKFIGNAVPVKMVRALMRASYRVATKREKLLEAA